MVGREGERERGSRPGVPRARARAVDHVARGPEVGEHRAGAGTTSEAISACSFNTETGAERRVRRRRLQRVGGRLKKKRDAHELAFVPRQEDVPRLKIEMED